MHSHSTSDFPAILAGVTNKTLRNAYDTAPRTYPAIARRTTVADFKLVHRLQLGEAWQLEKVNQSGEFKRGTIGEAQESYRIETFGKVIGITRQVLINDDLDAFTRVPALFSRTSGSSLPRSGWRRRCSRRSRTLSNSLFRLKQPSRSAACAVW